MITEEHEVPNGWPLGLENITMRLQVTEESSPTPAATTTTAQPSSFRVPSSSFSSFSSSNLDTESTISFFQDNSVTLGRLIGIKVEDRRSLVQFQGDEIIGEQVLDSVASENQESETSHGISCVPLLHVIIMKRSPSKSKARVF